MSKETQDNMENEVVEDLFTKLEMPLLFGKYDIRDVKVTDPGLKRYINLHPIMVAHSGGTKSNKNFGSADVSIIERLINSMMRTENYTGKKMKAHKVVMDAMEIINRKKGENPVQVLVRAIEKSGPTEETTQIRYGGISVPKAVDVSPSRRLSIALSNNSKGAVKASFKKKKDIASCLAQEIMNAANGDKSSFAVQRKEEMERMAQSAR